MDLLVEQTPEDRLAIGSMSIAILRDPKLVATEPKAGGES
jgi:hypothetical protein